MSLEFCNGLALLLAHLPTKASSKEENRIIDIGGRRVVDMATRKACSGRNYLF
jgi:hypothetical protein